MQLRSDANGEGIKQMHGVACCERPGTGLVATPKGTTQALRAEEGIAFQPWRLSKGSLDKAFRQTMKAAAEYRKHAEEWRVLAQPMRTR